MIVALKLSFASLSNIELQKAFSCLNNIIKFSFSFIIKNHLLLRAQKVQSILLKELFDDVKIFMSMNYWSSFNRQKFLTINAYFIDQQWCYHEILLIFEHVTNFHIKTKLTKIMQKIIARHKLKDRIYVITNDNARNNLIMHKKLIRLLRIKLFDNVDTNVRDIKRIFCLAHVIQLALRELLDKIKINSTNENFRTNWDDTLDRATMKKKKRSIVHVDKNKHMIVFFDFVY
jgi:hypothetical protein